MDDELKRFAISIIQFGKPIFFIPWPMVNRVYSPKGTIYSKDRTDPVAVNAAWTHLHEIFKSPEANQYAVWGLHVLPLGSQQSLDAFKIDPNLFDWVGFAMYTLKCSFQENFLLNVTDAYEWAELNYPSKPAAIVEMGRVDTNGQSKWITNAYKIIKRLPRIKMAIYSEYESAGFGAGCGGTLISEKAKAKYKEATIWYHINLELVPTVRSPAPTQTIRAAPEAVSQIPYTLFARPLQDLSPHVPR